MVQSGYRRSVGSCPPMVISGLGLTLDLASAKPAFAGGPGVHHSSPGEGREGAYVKEIAPVVWLKPLVELHWRELNPMATSNSKMGLQNTEPGLQPTSVPTVVISP